MAITGWMASGRTSRLMSVAAEAWRRGLVDVSAGNKRLYYFPLRVGTLRLADAESSAFARLLRGDEVKLSELVPDDGTPDGLATAARAHKAADLLAAKGKVGEEETGDNPVRLAIGLATWTQEEPVVSGQSGPRRGRATQAPLLLAPVTFTLIPATRVFRACSTASIQFFARELDEVDIVAIPTDLGVVRVTGVDQTIVDLAGYPAPGLIREHTDGAIAALLPRRDGSHMSGDIHRWPQGSDSEGRSLP